MGSALAENRAQRCVAVEYMLDGDRTAAAVARGDSQLIAVALASNAVACSAVIGDMRKGLLAIGPTPRIYDDAVLARTIERVYDLPTVECFDDVSIMRRLLGLAGASGAVPPPPGSSCERRAGETINAYRSLPDRLLASGLDYAYAGVELPIVDAVVTMTINGLAINAEALREIEASYSARVEILRRQIAETIGAPLDPDNDDRVAELLYDRLGLPVPLRTRAGARSVRGASLAQLAHLHPVVPLLRESRMKREVLRAGLTLAQHLEPEGRVRGILDPIGAATGRFTCKEPNLQGLHRDVRRVVCAAPGHVLIEADTSQAEFRVLGHFSQDPSLLHDFAQECPVDLHRRTAAQALGKPESAVTPRERDIGKAVNFGIIYGETEYGLALQLGVSLEQARDFIDGFFRGRPGVRRWIASVHQQVRRTGYVTTLSGRRRALPTTWASSSAELSEVERRAVNTIIQGSAADLLKLAIARLHAALPADCRLLLTVHDSVLVEAPTGLAEEASAVLRRTMEARPLGFTVPFRVEVKSGPTWGDMYLQT